MSEKGNNNFDVIREAAEQRLSRDFPALYKDTFVLVDTPTNRLAIDDISYLATSDITELLEFLFVACKGDIQAFRAENVTKALASKVSRLVSTVNPRKTAVLFPGQGAQVVQDLLPEALLAEMTQITVPTKRQVNPQTKAVDGVTVEDVATVKKTLSGKKIDTVLVLDDAIVTGATLTALRETFPVRNAEWFAGSLFMLSPIQNRKRANESSSIGGYNAILTPIVYQGTRGIPALNSLSTLIGQSEKSCMVRERYIKDFVDDPDIFQDMIQQLQQAVPLQS